MTAEEEAWRRREDRAEREYEAERFNSIRLW